MKGNSSMTRFPRFNMILISAATVIIMVFPARAADVSRQSGSVVKLYVTSQYWNLTQPWTKLASQSTTCTGFFIREGILTNGHCVANSTYLEVEIPGHPDKYEAEVVAVNHQVDLSLVRLKDSRVATGIRTIGFGSLPEHRQKVVTIGYPTGGRQISYTEGVVSRIDILPYAHSRMPNLIIQTDAAINPGNSGGPVFSDSTGECLGVATQKNTRGEGLGYFVPTVVVQQFLKDAADGKIEGVSNLGITVQTLESEAFRAYLKMKPGQSGIRVKRIAAGSSADGVFLEGDVILSVDEKQVFNDGRITFRTDTTIGFGYVLAPKSVGEILKARILRDGVEKSLDVVLKPYVTSIIPDMPRYDLPPRFVVAGGLVFLAVDPIYLWTFGGGGGEDDDRLPITLRDYTSKLVGESGLKELVIVSQVLNAPVNRGYNFNVRNIRVTEINGKPVASLEDIRNNLDPPEDRDYLEVILEDNSRIVVNHREMDAQESVIRERYNIR